MFKNAEDIETMLNKIWLYWRSDANICRHLILIILNYHHSNMWVYMIKFEIETISKTAKNIIKKYSLNYIVGGEISCNV